ncbi:hypothetical protein EZV61_18680 [Corallincola luteus]|uniref:Uncharacterized protein n=2 Tax=Corallincola TaxID=1775176 RepID=A0A368N402_9GAMM|nr:MULTISPECIES: hypothetical protein [Corallincola]RCU45297.1 hypothetical protein DU002_16420 [Corallincola holothuriorum]TCI01301.1 hypothetical protein EZV61_18680 [Corallincola luteus]
MRELVKKAYTYIYKLKLNHQLNQMKRMTNEVDKLTLDEAPKLPYNQALMDDLIEYLDSEEVVGVEFVYDYAEFEWLVDDLADFFNVEIVKTKENQYLVSGEVIDPPVTGTFCDSQIFTASVYNSIPDSKKSEVYCDSSGRFLLLISDERYQLLKNKYGDLLGFKSEQNLLPNLSKWKPGMCAYSGINYPYSGGHTDMISFVAEYIEHLKLVYRQHPDLDLILEEAASKLSLIK